MLVGRQVGARGEVERVGHVCLPGRRVERAVGAEQVDVAAPGVERVGHHDLRARAGNHARRVTRGAGRRAGVLRHERDLVVGVEVGVGVGPDARAGVGVAELRGRGEGGVAGAVRAAGEGVRVRQAQVHELALVHLHRDLLPAAGPGERDDAAGRGAVQDRHARAGDHDRVVRTGKRRRRGGGGRQRERHQPRERNPAPAHTGFRRPGGART